MGGIWLQLACVVARLMPGALGPSSSAVVAAAWRESILGLMSRETLKALSSPVGALTEGCRLQFRDLSRLLTARAFKMVAVKGFDARNSLSYTYSSTNFLLVLSGCVCPLFRFCVCSVSTTCLLRPYISEASMGR